MKNKDFNYGKDEKRDIYIGLSASAAFHLWAIHTKQNRWEMVIKQTQELLLRRKLVIVKLNKNSNADAKTSPLGQTVCNLYNAIYMGKWKPKPPAVNEHVLGIDSAAAGRIVMRRKLTVKSWTGDILPMRSVHVKVLRMVARVPGVSIYYLERIFSEAVILDLVNSVYLHKTKQAVGVDITGRGINLLNDLADELSKAALLHRKPATTSSYGG